MVTVALFVLFFAQGYKLNIKNFKITKTGIIFLSTEQKGASVYINGTLQESKTPFAKNLTPGTYTASVTKAGYRDWYQSFKITPELVTSFDSIVLFKTNPEISTLTDERKINLLNSPIDYFAVSNNEKVLTHNDYEIWTNNTLITRFSSPIQSVSWYSDVEHILYQQGNEIKIMDITGANSCVLVKLESNSPENYITNSRGDELYFSDDGEYKMAKIK